jgi:hypothetical protein
MQISIVKKQIPFSGISESDLNIKIGKTNCLE